MWDPEAVLGYSVSNIDVPDPYQSKGKSSTLSGKLQNTFHLSPINTVVAGLDFYNKDSEYNDPFDNGLTEAADNIGIFAQARLEPTDNLKISAGLRYDWQDFTGSGGYEDSVSGASGNASVTYFLTENFSLRAGYSNVFGGLQLEDNYEFWRRWDYVGLRPSQSENYTIGFDWVHSNNFAIGGEYFLTQINDVRDGQDNFDFESEGFNLGASYGWAEGSMRLTYSNSDITVNGSAAGSYDALDLGAPLGQVLVFEVQQSLPNLNILVGGNLDVAFDYDGTIGSSDQAVEGYQVVNLFAEYAPPSLPGVTFRASVYNLFDQAYADRATYGADYVDIVPLSEPGRTVVVEAVARF